MIIIERQSFMPFLWIFTYTQGHKSVRVIESLDLFLTNLSADQDE